ncbi:UNVERIFIED_CONTAM: hypothetical protein FKN15_029021 [Acipenser sinensis]
MDRNALAELLQALESRRDAEERRREERYTALIERVGLAVAAATTPTTTPMLGAIDRTHVPLTPPAHSEHLQTLISPYTPTRPLRSACTRRLALPPLRSPASRARSFSTLAPQWWNDLPTDVRTAQSLTTFRRLLKTHLFRQHL